MSLSRRLYFMFAFFEFCIFSYTVLSVSISISISQVIGCEDRLRNDLDCVGAVKLLNVHCGFNDAMFNVMTQLCLM